MITETVQTTAAHEVPYLHKEKLSAHNLTNVDLLIIDDKYCLAEGDQSPSKDGNDAEKSRSWFIYNTPLIGYAEPVGIINPESSVNQDDYYLVLLPKRIGADWESARTVIVTAITQNQLQNNIVEYTKGGIFANLSVRTEQSNLFLNLSKELPKHGLIYNKISDSLVKICDPISGVLLATLIQSDKKTWQLGITKVATKVENAKQADALLKVVGHHFI